MTDGRCRFGPRAKREMGARLLAGETARQVARSMGCSPTTVTTTRARWLGATDTERADGSWCAPGRAGPAVVSVEAERRRGAAHPRRACPHELGADAPDVADRTASL